MSLFINLCFTLHFMIQTTKVEMQITVKTNEVTITVNEILKLLEVPAAKTAVVTIHGVLSATCNRKECYKIWKSKYSINSLTYDAG